MAKPVILVAGGAGYIGAHFCKAAARAGFAPVVVDRLTSPSPRVEDFRRRAVEDFPLEVADIGDQKSVLNIIRKHKPVAAACFAALIEVSESMMQPDLYWENNFLKMAHFFQALEIAEVTKVVFSSTAAVYGIPAVNKPLTERDLLDPINPYGMTKLGCEVMLHGSNARHVPPPFLELLSKRSEGLKSAHPDDRQHPFFPRFESVVFRYFNAAGAAFGLGEMHEPETHLIPTAIFAAEKMRDFADGKKKFTLYGTDYPTRDGTPIRDYVHVEDLAAAHVTGLEYLLDGGKSDVFNLGTGHGASVQEVVHTVRKTTGKDFTVTEGPRRAGDPPFLVADAAKAASILNWKPMHDLNNIVSSALDFHCQQG